MKPGSKRAVVLSLLLLTACGDDGDSHDDGSQGIATLAYVVTECREDQTEVVSRQRLVVRHANGDLVTIKEFPMFGPFPAKGLCPVFGGAAWGWTSIVGFPFQRLGVSRDGSTVVFEINDDFSAQAPNAVLPADRSSRYRPTGRTCGS
jgi:hypothetical protein